jgi:hypothetical protein
MRVLCIKSRYIALWGEKVQLMIWGMISVFINKEITSLKKKLWLDITLYNHPRNILRAIKAIKAVKERVGTKKVEWNNGMMIL